MGHNCIIWNSKRCFCHHQPVASWLELLDLAFFWPKSCDFHWLSASKVSYMAAMEVKKNKSLGLDLQMEDFDVSLLDGRWQWVKTW